MFEFISAELVDNFVGISLHMCPCWRYLAHLGILFLKKFFVGMF